MIGWPLQPLLDLRTREEEEAAGGLSNAERAWRLVEAEARAARAAAAELAGRVLQVQAPARLEAVIPSRLAGEERCRDRLRLELARRHRLLEELEGRVQSQAAEAARRRERWRVAAVRRAVVARLAEAWRRGRAAAAERRAEAALDDRPWPGGPGR